MGETRGLEFSIKRRKSRREGSKFSPRYQPSGEESNPGLETNHGIFRRARGYFSILCFHAEYLAFFLRAWCILDSIEPSCRSFVVTRRRDFPNIPKFCSKFFLAPNFFFILRDWNLKVTRGKITWVRWNFVQHVRGFNFSRWIVSGILIEWFESALRM